MLLTTRRVLPQRLDARIRLPRDLAAVTTVGVEDDPADAGMTQRQVERIWRSAVALYRTGAHPSVVLTVRRHGKVVVNRAIGHAWGNGPADPPDAEKVLATPDTPYCTYSASKGFTATMVHALAERGWFDLDDPVADYVEGFGAHGKQGIRIRDVLTHRAGIPFLPKGTADLDRIGDREFIRQTMIDLRPSFKPGTRLVYHALSGGFLLEEVVLSATGRTLREHLAELVLDPLGFRWSNYGVSPADVPLVAPAYRTGPAIPRPFSNLVAKVLSASLDDVVAMSMDPRFLTAIVPSANVVSTAGETARFYEILTRGGELDGVRLMQPSTLEAATRTTARLEPDIGLGGIPMRYGVGYMMGADRVSVFGQHADRAFGHVGLMNTLGYADPERAMSVGLMTSGKVILYDGLVQFIAVPTTIAAIVRKIPEADVPF